MNTLRYSLIRFIPNRERMEPVNFGVILQGPRYLDFKLYPHFARRKDVDTAVIQRWKAFLQEEIKGDTVSMFQPPKNSPSFLTHLSGLCEHTVSITQPLILQERDDVLCEDVLTRLYERLVAPVDEPKREPSSRPTFVFRAAEDTRQFRKRGMRKHPYISVPRIGRWNAYRQVLNGENIVVDKVEVGNSVGLTADEIQKLSTGVDGFLEGFLTTAAEAPPRYVLIADNLTDQFTEQTKDDFESMKQELHKVVESVQERGGRVIRNPDEVEGFIEELDRKLPPLEAVKARS